MAPSRIQKLMEIGNAEEKNVNDSGAYTKTPTIEQRTKTQPHKIVIK